MQLSLSQSLSLPLVKEKNVAPDTVRNGKEDFIEDYHSRGESGLDSTSDSDRCTLVANGQGEWMKGRRSKQRFAGRHRGSVVWKAAPHARHCGGSAPRVPHTPARALSRPQSQMTPRTIPICPHRRNVRAAPTGDHLAGAGGGAGAASLENCCLSFGTSFLN